MKKYKYWLFIFLFSQLSLAQEVILCSFKFDMGALYQNKDKFREPYISLMLNQENNYKAEGEYYEDGYEKGWFSGPPRRKVLLSYDKESKELKVKFKTRHTTSAALSHHSGSSFLKIGSEGKTFLTNSSGKDYDVHYLCLDIKEVEKILSNTPNEGTLLYELYENFNHAREEGKVTGSSGKGLGEGNNSDQKSSGR